MSRLERQEIDLEPIQLLLFFIYLFAHKTLHKMYCNVQREQDNKAQITGTNSCSLSLNHTATDTNAMQCIQHFRNCVKSTFIMVHLKHANDEKYTTGVESSTHL